MGKTRKQDKSSLTYSPYVKVADCTRLSLSRTALPRAPNEALGRLNKLPPVGIRAPGKAPSIKSIEQAFFRFSRSPPHEPPRLSDLHTDAQTRLRQANEKYASLTGPGAKLPLTSALRSPRRQLGLFIAYAHHQYGGPTALPANPPGRSMHHFGLAIDVSLKRSAKSIVNALKTTGWDQNKLPNDPVHFEDTGTAAYKEAMSTIASNRPSIDRIQKSVSDFLNVRNQYNDLIGSYTAIAQTIATEIRSRREKRKAISKARTAINSKHLAIAPRMDKLKPQAQTIDNERARINAMQYNRCPNGHPFQKCTHNKRKSSWCNEKRNAVAAYNRRVQNYRKQYERLSQDVHELRAKTREWNAVSKEFVAAARAFAPKMLELKKMERRLKGFVGLMRKNLVKIRQELIKLERSVNGA